jgi:hypothetical protein
MHFPALNERAKFISFSAESYAAEDESLREDFKSRFRDLIRHLKISV